MSFSGSLLSGTSLSGGQYYGAGLTVTGEWTPYQLFAAGEVGAWYDPSDLSTLFQDAAGTTPVTAPGQVVGLMLDKSGRGNHATQSGATSVRPIYRVDAGGRPYLEFDGIDDWLQTDTITPGVDKAQVFAGVRKLSDAQSGIIAELGANSNSINGAFAVLFPRSGTFNEPVFVSRGTSTVFAASNSTAFPAPITNVLTGLGDISGNRAILIINGAQALSSTGDQGTGNYLAYPLYIGRRGGASLPFNGHLYGLIVRFGANLSPVQIKDAERWMNGKTGAY